MTLPPGTRLGPYEVLALIGTGGMGEVYRAKDARLDRTVAIKILPRHVVDRPRRRQRFERESRVASRLSHPNICALYDIGQQGEIHFIVMEYLEGETLADRLRRGPLPISLVLRYAIETADALSHAHQQGIVHRDLKPANIMLARSASARSGSAQAKLLDFGVAQLRGPADDGFEEMTSHETETQSLTEEGTILGTIQYMSPEQLEGKDTDARTDIFSLGAVVYEMAAGRAAFEATSKASLIAAILAHEPPTLSTASGATPAQAGEVGPIPPLLDRIVSKCLAKDPDARWQTAADLRQALEWVAEGAQVGEPERSSAPPWWRRERIAWVAAAMSLMIAVWSYLAVRSDPSDAPLTGVTFKPLTFRRGWSTAARFAPDGQTVIYSSVWGAGPVRLFETRTSGPESRRLGPEGAGLASISSTNELALLSDCRLDHGYCIGTLARMPVSGGAPREVLAGVTWADWTPDGRELAAIRLTQGTYRLEFPIGKELYTTSGWLEGLAFSPRGDRLAFTEHPILGIEAGVLKVIDLEGRATTISSNWKTIRGISWSPRGDEIWFTASQTGKNCSLYAVSLSGQLRLIFHAPGDLTLWDIAPDGRLLVSVSSAPPRARMIWASAGKERELSWLDWSTVADLSTDGKTVLFHEWGEGVGATPAVYIHNVDSSDPARLGDGKALSLSPDGRWALALVEGVRPQLVLLPTGTGQRRLVPSEGLTDVYRAKWFPDGRRVLLVAAGADLIPRSFVLDLETGKREPFGDEGSIAMLVSPDGREVLALDPSGVYYLWPLTGGEPVPVPGLQPNDRPVQWSGDGRHLFVRDGEETALRIYRYTIATKRIEPLHELTPPDPTGVIGIATGRGEVAMTPDGRSYVYTYWVWIEDLFLAEGVRH
jgi:serine/threonine protein kinase/Tol biopolymer transport system component